MGYNMFGYYVHMYGGPISFAAKLLKIVALSSAEAEYAAASYTAKEVAFVRNLLTDLHFQLSSPTVIAVDNQAAIRIAENRGVTARTKHFIDAVHYIRHQIDHQSVRLQFVRTNEQRADGFTKALDKTKFLTWCKMLMGLIVE